MINFSSSTYIVQLPQSMFTDNIILNIFILACDNCTQWLLNELDNMKIEFSEIYNDYMNADPIYELYKKLDEIDNRTVELEDLYDDYVYIQDKTKQLSIEPVNELHKVALTLKREHVFGKVKKLNIEINRIKDESERIMDNLEKMFESIEQTIEDLDNSGTEHIEVKNALMEGEEELNVIRKIQVPISDFKKVKNYCFDLLSFIKQLNEDNYINPKDIKQDFDYFRKRINDIKKYIHKSFNNIHEVEKQTMNLDKRIVALKNAIEEIEDMQEDLMELEDLQEDLHESNDMLLEATKKYNDMINSIDTFDDLLTRVEERIDESNKAHELQRVLKAAREHADMLVKLAKDYNQ